MNGFRERREQMEKDLAAVVRLRARCDVCEGKVDVCHSRGRGRSVCAAFNDDGFVRVFSSRAKQPWETE